MSRLSAEAAVPTAMSARSPDATTRAPSVRTGRQGLQVTRPGDVGIDLALQALGTADEDRAVQSVGHLLDGECGEHGQVA